jgi:hypothetical protein
MKMGELIGMQAADDILTVSLGDEIGVAGAGNDIGFISFLRSKNTTPADVDCALFSWSAVLQMCNQTTLNCPVCGRNTSIANAVTAGGQRLYYYSKLYANEAGLLEFRGITNTIRKTLKNAKIGGE